MVKVYGPVLSSVGKCLELGFNLQFT